MNSRSFSSIYIGLLSISRIPLGLDKKLLEVFYQEAQKHDGSKDWKLDNGDHHEKVHTISHFKRLSCDVFIFMSY
jgi:hypothetical protein